MRKVTLGNDAAGDRHGAREALGGLVGREQLEGGKTASARQDTLGPLPFRGARHRGDKERLDQAAGAVVRRKQGNLRLIVGAGRRGAHVCGMQGEVLQGDVPGFEPLSHGSVLSL